MSDLLMPDQELIATLRGREDWYARYASVRLATLLPEISSLRKEVADLREAARPFAAYGRAAFLGSRHPDEMTEVSIYSPDFGDAEVTVGDFRRLATLTEGEGK